jgi:Uma2 family endonuclease
MATARKIPEESRIRSFEEYLVWEEGQEERHEFVNGQVVAMAGASDSHELVAGNLFATILNHLRGKGCRVYKGDMKLRFRAGEVDLSYYPDVMVTCDPTDDHSHYKERPRFLAEVMTNFKEDHFGKLFIYQQIESLQEYLIVGQDPEQPKAWLYRRAEHWAMPEPVTTGRIELASLELRLPLGALFAT